MLQSLRDTVAAQLLSPSEERLAIAGLTREANFANGTANTTPGFAQPTIKLPILNDRTQGLYFPWGSFSIINNVGGGHVITLSDTLFTIVDNFGDEIAPLGGFEVTTLSVESEVGSAFYIPKQVWTAAELDTLSKAAGGGSGIFVPGAQPLAVLASVGGTASAATSFTLVARLVAALISGLTGLDVQ